MKGGWQNNRKIRIVRLIEKVIEAGIRVAGMEKVYTDMCSVLTRMGRATEFSELTSDEKDLICELYLLRLCGQQKNVTGDRWNEDLDGEKSVEIEVGSRVQSKFTVTSVDDCRRRGVKCVSIKQVGDWDADSDYSLFGMNKLTALKKLSLRPAARRI